MKVKVINQELSDFNHSFKVKNINYDMVIVEEDDKAIPFSMEDIELVAENKYDDLIIEHKDLLKIKLGNNISMELYAALVNCIEVKVNDKLISLDVLRDEYSINKRGIWEKKLVIVVNHMIPLDVTVIGEKYADKFSITFKDITLQSFLEGCSENIRHLRKEIEEKENAIRVYKRAVSEVLKNSVNMVDENTKKLTSVQ